MAPNDLSWVADAAGFPCVEQRGEKLVLNDIARALVDGAPDARTALAILTGVAVDDAALDALVGELGDDGCVALVGRSRVLVRATETGRIALCIPATVETAYDVHRRASATDLSAAVSHELSNVLGAILGWASLARRTEPILSERMDRALSLIEASARGGHATARHLLATARGPIVGQSEDVDVGVLVEEIVEVLAPRAESDGVSLEREVETELVAHGARGQLFTVAWNLIQNAIEATPRGGAVRVRVRGVADTIELDVEDDGPGIPADDRERVFEAYYTTKSQGTGLGLSLVKRAATEMSGTVVLLDSERGAHFRVTVPRGAAARARKSHRASGVLERGSPRGKRILVVDDDEAMRELLATALGIAGAVVETADSGAAALAKAGPFDLVLIDLGLGDIRGDEVLARMRNDGRARRTALVSGATLPPIVSPGGEPDAWLRKPFEIEELLSHVRTLLTNTPISQGGAGSSSS